MKKIEETKPIYCGVDYVGIIRDELIILPIEKIDKLHLKASNLIWSESLCGIDNYLSPSEYKAIYYAKDTPP